MALGGAFFLAMAVESLADCSPDSETCSSWAAQNSSVGNVGGDALLQRKMDMVDDGAATSPSYVKTGVGLCDWHYKYAGQKTPTIH